MVRSFFAAHFVVGLRLSLKQIILPGFFGISAVFISGCNKNTAIVRGQVTQLSGNQMPSPDLPQGNNPQAFATRLAICNPIQANYSKANPQLLEKLPTNAVRTIRTKPDGSFKDRVKAGTYTLLIETPSGWWAPYVRDNLLYPITLRQGQDTTLRLQVTVDAVF